MNMKGLFDNLLNKFAVIGYPISHSKSPEIYNFWMQYTIPESYYTRISARTLKEIRSVDKIINLKGYNLTSPLKDVFNFSYNVNTIVKVDEKLNYYNTDIEYFEDLIDELKLNNKKILIIGGGESAKNIAKSLDNRAFDFSFILRNPETKDDKIYFNKQLLNILNINDIISDFDVIVNTIKFTSEYLHPEIKFENKIIIDLIYQQELFKNRISNCEYYSGYDWLNGQAKKSFSYYFPDFEVEEIYLEILKKKKHKAISLIGFMGSGKSTLGKLLADKLSYKFVDTDDLIIEKYGPIRNIFQEHGEERFREMEFEALQSIDLSKNTIISTGGGIINGEDSTSYLEQNTFRIWLLNSAGKVYRRIIGSDRPLLSKVGVFVALFEYRKNIYFSNSDLIVYNNHLNDCLERLVEEVNNYAK